MPAWTLKSTAAKMLQNLSPNTTGPRSRKGSIDVHVHTQRSYFVEPTRSVTCDDYIGHRSKLTAPYVLPPKYEKECSGRTKPRLKPLKIRNGDDENTTPTDEKSKGAGLVDRNRRRYGLMYYPESVRDELRRARTRSRSPRLKTQFTPSPTASFCAEQITVSSAREWVGFEPPSWFSVASESGDPSRFSMSTTEAPSGRIINESAPSSPLSWKTFRVPSIPPSPVESIPSPVSATPRDPRLPPADYLLYKDMYDDVAIKMHGKLPAEWVAYSHRHLAGPSRI